MYVKVMKIKLHYISTANVLQQSLAAMSEVTEVMKRRFEHGKIRGTDESEMMWEKDATAYFGAPSGIFLGRLTKSVKISAQAVDPHQDFELLCLLSENQTFHCTNLLSRLYYVMLPQQT
jgi:hypothetical protein